MDFLVCFPSFFALSFIIYCYMWASYGSLIFIDAQRPIEWLHLWGAECLVISFDSFTAHFLMFNDLSDCDLTFLDILLWICLLKMIDSCFYQILYGTTNVEPLHFKFCLSFGEKVVELCRYYELRPPNPCERGLFTQSQSHGRYGFMVSLSHSPHFFFSLSRKNVKFWFIL